VELVSPVSGDKHFTEEHQLRALVRRLLHSSLEAG
jgi:hypothetical protein